MGCGTALKESPADTPGFSKRDTVAVKNVNFYDHYFLQNKLGSGIVISYYTFLRKAHSQKSGVQRTGQPAMYEP